MSEPCVYQNLNQAQLFGVESQVIKTHLRDALSVTWKVVSSNSSGTDTQEGYQSQGQRGTIVVAQVSDRLPAEHHAWIDAEKALFRILRTVGIPNTYPGKDWDTDIVIHLVQGLSKVRHMMRKLYATKEKHGIKPEVDDAISQIWHHNAGLNYKLATNDITRVIDKIREGCEPQIYGVIYRWIDHLNRQLRLSFGCHNYSVLTTDHREWGDRLMTQKLKNEPLYSMELLETAKSTPRPKIKLVWQPLRNTPKGPGAESQLTSPEKSGGESKTQFETVEERAGSPQTTQALPSVGQPKTIILGLPKKNERRGLNQYVDALKDKFLS
ncbi:hypothetical protein EDC01DRAFT_634173 [Geopyxis carbonaria]|nr:hypothetical protein EDC01DRAFT_634173 [Geopyxis carbonaria]